MQYALCSTLPFFLLACRLQRRPAHRRGGSAQAATGAAATGAAWDTSRAGPSLARGDPSVYLSRNGSGGLPGGSGMGMVSPRSAAAGGLGSPASPGRSLALRAVASPRGRRNGGASMGMSGGPTESELEALRPPAVRVGLCAGRHAPRLPAPCPRPACLQARASALAFESNIRDWHEEKGAKPSGASPAARGGGSASPTRQRRAVYPWSFIVSKEKARQQQQQQQQQAGGAMSPLGSTASGFMPNHGGMRR